MNFGDQWRSISARIKGFTSAAALHASFLQVRDSDNLGRGSYLALQCFDTLSDVESFVSRFKDSLPNLATSAIDSFLTQYKQLFKEAVDGSDLSQEKSRAVLVLLAGLETQISFLLNDTQAVIKARSELAFSHLQRSIVADIDFRKKWHRAYKAGETACEALGAVHLLSHGIYAFKVSAAGGITDLVFQDPVRPNAHQHVDGMVLTEWKKAVGRNVEQAFGAARRQARLYAPGVFSGSELTRYRFAVVVSDEPATTPSDLELEGVLYRHILLVINPSTPSKLAKRKPR